MAERTETLAGPSTRVDVPMTPDEVHEARFTWLGPAPRTRITHQSTDRLQSVSIAITPDGYIHGPSTIIEDTEAQVRALITSGGGDFSELRWGAVVHAGALASVGSPWSPGEPLPDNLIELVCRGYGITRSKGVEGA